MQFVGGCFQKLEHLPENIFENENTESFHILCTCFFAKMVFENTFLGLERPLPSKVLGSNSPRCYQFVSRLVHMGGGGFPGFNRGPASGRWDPKLVYPWAGYRVIKNKDE